MITYRELRRLETRVLRELNDRGQLTNDVELISLVNLNQFYGIELSEFPARIAEVSMWMMDHLMNQELSELGRTDARIPLTETAIFGRPTLWKSIGMISSRLSGVAMS